MSEELDLPEGMEDLGDEKIFYCDICWVEKRHRHVLMNHEEWWKCKNCGELSKFHTEDM